MRKPPPVKLELPPRLASGARSSKATLAPCSAADSAAHNAALPPPTTTTSYCESIGTSARETRVPCSGTRFHRHPSSRRPVRACQREGQYATRPSETDAADALASGTVEPAHASKIRLLRHRCAIVDAERTKIVLGADV